MGDSDLTRDISYPLLKSACADENYLMTSWHKFVLPGNQHYAACHNCRSLLEKPYEDVKRIDQFLSMSHEVIKSNMAILVKKRILVNPGQRGTFNTGTMEELRKKTIGSRDLNIFEQVGVAARSKRAPTDVAHPSGATKQTQTDYWNNSFKLSDHPCVSALRALNELIKNQRKPGSNPPTPKLAIKGYVSDDLLEIADAITKKGASPVTFWVLTEFIKQHLYCLGRLADTHHYNKAYIANFYVGTNSIYLTYDCSLFEVPRQIDKPILFLMHHINEFLVCELRPNFLDDPSKTGSVLRFYYGGSSAMEQKAFILVRKSIREYLDSFEHTQTKEIEPITTQLVTGCPSHGPTYQGSLFACEIIRRLMGGIEISNSEPLDISKISDACRREKDALFERHKLFINDTWSIKKTIKDTVDCCPYCKIFDSDTKSTEECCNEFRALAKNT